MPGLPGPGHRYQLAVVGAGIAGSETALAAARDGVDVLLVTTSLDTVYLLADDRTRLEPPPGTMMAELYESQATADGKVESWSLHRAAKYLLEAQPGIHLLQSNVTALLVDDGRASGVATWEGVERRADEVALCVGSFLHARLEQGRLREAAGRLGEMAYDDLYEDLANRGVAFVPRSLESSGTAETPPYTVSFRAIAETEFVPPGSATKRPEGEFMIARLPGLYAAGSCAHGPVGYAEAAASGARLGRALAARRSDADGSP